MTGWSLSPDGGVNLTLAEEDAAVWDWDPAVDERATGESPSVVLPNPGVIAAPASIVVTTPTSTSFAALAVSWAAVFCKGGSYVGYKGSTVAFPSRSGRFSLKETAALGAPKLLITRTHHWLTAGMVSLEDLCTDGFRERMKGSRAATLPAKAGRYRLAYDAGDNSLKVSW